MNIVEFYKTIGGDYDEVLSRILKEERILKYVNRFSEGDEMTQCEKALEEKDYATAFRMVHSIKGLALNLGFSRLKDASSVLCELLRNGDPEVDVTIETSKVRLAYDEVCEAIKLIEN